MGVVCKCSKCPGDVRPYDSVEDPLLCRDCIKDLVEKVANLENREREVVDNLLLVLRRMESPECYAGSIEKQLRWLWKFVESQKVTDPAALRQIARTYAYVAGQFFDDGQKQIEGLPEDVRVASVAAYRAAVEDMYIDAWHHVEADRATVTSGEKRALLVDKVIAAAKEARDAFMMEGAVYAGSIVNRSLVEPLEQLEEYDESQKT